MNLFIAVIISATTAVASQEAVQSAVRRHHPVTIDALEQLDIEFGQAMSSQRRATKAPGRRRTGLEPSRQAKGPSRSQRSYLRGRAAGGISPRQVMPMGPPAPAVSPRYSTGVEKRPQAPSGARVGHKSGKSTPSQPPERLDRWNYILHRN